MDDPQPARGPELVRGLGAWDGALITVGSVVGTGIFLTTADMARALPHPGLILLCWVAGGLFTLAGALTFGELGALYPRAGGQYHYLKEAFGPLWGFLFGWASLLVIMTGGVATLAVSFGEYLGFFAPFFSTSHVLFTVALGPAAWSVSGGQVAGALAIVLITLVNVLGVREGATVQNAVTVIKMGALVALGVLGLLAPVPAATAAGATAVSPAAPITMAAFGVAMISVMWSYDGWYAVSGLAGEMKRPSRDLPWALLAGSAAVMGLYLLANVVFLRALPVGEIAGSGRVAERVAAVLFGPWGARLISAAVLVSCFGCTSSTILYAARAYLPMAEDGLFFRGLARIHPHFRTPVACLLVQAVLSIVQTFSGTYAQLYTYVVFMVFVFHALIGLALFKLRRSRPRAERPYRAWGYPLVPAVFVLASIALVANTLWEKPAESLGGLALVASGVPVYLWWRRRSAAAPPR